MAGPGTKSQISNKPPPTHLLASQPSGSSELFSFFVGLVVGFPLDPPRGSEDLTAQRSQQSPEPRAVELSLPPSAPWTGTGTAAAASGSLRPRTGGRRGRARERARVGGFRSFGPRSFRGGSKGNRSFFSFFSVVSIS